MADYLISKEKWIQNSKTIDSFFVHHDNGNSAGEGIERNRNWIISQLKNERTFCCIHKNEDGIWSRGNPLILKENGGLSWKDNLPLIQTQRKSFISYYHNDDSDFKEKFENLTSDIIVNKSVEEGDIDADVSDEYAKQLIQKGYLNDTTVLIVLLGEKTKCRKHVDWEISGALNYKVGDNYAGLLGLILPTHHNYGTGKHTYSLLPQRLSDNLKTKYAIIRDYTTDRKKIQEYIELAFKNRTNRRDDKTNSRIQMQNDTCN